MPHTIKDITSLQDINHWTCIQIYNILNVIILHLNQQIRRDKFIH